MFDEYGLDVQEIRDEIQGDYEIREDVQDNIEDMEAEKEEEQKEEELDEYDGVDPRDTRNRY